MTPADLGFRVPDWHDGAACKPALWVGKQRPEWFIDVGRSARPAKAVCNSCPVVEECLAEALANPWMLGIWGGTSERQRLAIRRKRAQEAA